MVCRRLWIIYQMEKTKGIHIVPCTEPGHVSLDIKEFQTQMYQRTYQYLKRHHRGQSLDSFTYEKDFEDQPEDWLRIMCK